MADFGRIITEIKEVPGSKTRRLIMINDEPYFTLTETDIKKYRLEQGMELSDELFYTLEDDVLYNRGLNNCLYKLQAKEYTREELKAGLEKSGISRRVVENILKKLSEEGFINDERYAQQYIDYHGDLKAYFAIVAALKRKGINEDIIKKAYDSYKEENPDSEREACIRFLKSKFGEGFEYANENDESEVYKLKQKALRWLAGKGFSYDLAADVIKDFFDI